MLIKIGAESVTVQNLASKHEDMQGILGTALVGVTQWTPAQYRSTGIVLNEIQSGDVFSMIFQMSHRKKLLTNLDSIHLHFIPIGSANGNIRFSYEWGWYNHNIAIPATLPNTGNTSDIALLTTDQYFLKINSLISNLAYPASEAYSSILFCKFTAIAPSAGTDWWTAGGTNRIAIVYVDAHYISDRLGSTNETTD